MFSGFIAAHGGVRAVFLAAGILFFTLIPLISLVGRRRPSCSA